MQSMVIVEGDQGRGSGFIVKMDDRIYVVTNAHVIQGNHKLTFKTLNNKELAIGPLQIADSVDLVRAELKDPAPGLKMLQQVELKMKIGDEVVVAGNSEGEGVVREIPGKVVGIGPDRIEVDASFVLGNSGSPILLKSTGEVLGVATYLKIPLFFRGSSDTGTKEQPVTRLNEVRRFGYRLDTVSKWVSPKTVDGIMQEGLRLEEIDALDSTVTAVVRAGTSAIVKVGSSGFIRDEQKKKPGFQSLATFIDDFASSYKSAKSAEEKKEPLLKFFGQIKSLTSTDSAEADKEGLSGYHTVLLRERQEWRKGLHEWLDFMSHQAEKNSWVLQAPWWQEDDEVVDISKIHLPLEHQVDWTFTPDKRHRVVYPQSSKPSSLRNMVWVVENPRKRIEEIEMSHAALRISTTTNGTYRVHAEYRAGKSTQTISNVLEFVVSDVPQPNVEIDFSKEKPFEIAPSDKGHTPEWQELATLVLAEAYAKTPILGRDSISKVIKDLPDAGAILIGFECTITPFGSSNETVRGLRPVYLTKDGQRTGSIWGAQNGNSVFRLVANPGYAVGKITTRYDGTAIRRIKIRFDRICGLKLNPKDSYESAWIGEYENLEEVSADTNGRIPIGISGKHGAGLDGISLVCLTGENSASQPTPPKVSPKRFTSLDEIFSQIPPSSILKLREPATQKTALEEINRFLTANVKGKMFEGKIHVEMAAPFSSPSASTYRIKIPDIHVQPGNPIRARLWAYFEKADEPKTSPPIGSKMMVSGRLGRCEVTGEKSFMLNVDLHQSKQITEPDLKADETPKSVPKPE